MFEITATEARDRQRSQLDYYRDIWPEGIYKEIERRCEKAWEKFKGPVDVLLPYEATIDAVPRGGAFEQWHAELVGMQTFIRDIVAVCAAHKLWLGHEDSQGSFLVQKESTEEWLMAASWSAMV